MERAGMLGSTLLQPQPPQQQQQQPGGGVQPPHADQAPAQPQPDANKVTEATGQPGSLTAIFRPDDEGEWKEKLRLAHEASEQARAGQAGGSGISGAASWERRSREEEEEKKHTDGRIEAARVCDEKGA